MCERTANPRIKRATPEGLTLVELLAALVLSTLLMGAVLGVLRSLTRNQKAALLNSPTEEWQSRLTGQLEWDLVNSRSIAVTAAGFELRGFAGCDLKSGLLLHCPTLVQYGVATAGAANCLVRREIHVEATDLDEQSSELVSIQIEHIVFGVEDEKTHEMVPSVLNPNKTTADDMLIPERPVVAIYRIGEHTPIYYHAFVLR